MGRLSFRKVFYHLDHLEQYIRSGDCYPVHMIVGLTNLCNHSCIWCYGYDSISTHYNDNAFASSKMVLDTLRQAAQCGLRSVSLVGTGEPTLHPEYGRIAAGIKDAGVDIGVFTNGSRIDERMADVMIATHTFVRLSCSACNREQHNQLHHGGKQTDDFDRIVGNMERLIAKRGQNKFPTIGVQFLVSHRNWESLADACLFWKERGVDYIALKPVYQNPAIDKHEKNEAPVDQVLALLDRAKQLETPDFSVYTKKTQFNRVLAQSDKTRGYTRCHGQAFTTFLDPDGKFYICGNMHGKMAYCVGSIPEQGSFRGVWEGDRRKEKIKTLDLCNCPTGCRMDPLNLIIEDLLHPNPEDHPNFL